MVIHQFNKLIRNKWVWGVFAIAISAFFAFDFLVADLNRSASDDRSSTGAGTLAWHLSPRTQVIINRSVPAIGERMSVHTMTFDAAGKMQNERAFSEDCAEVNSGELVAKAKVSGEELAKRAAEVTETSAATDTEDAPAEEAAAEETTSNEELN